MVHHHQRIERLLSKCISSVIWLPNLSSLLIFSFLNYTAFPYTILGPFLIIRYFMRRHYNKPSISVNFETWNMLHCFCYFYLKWKICTTSRFLKALFWGVVSKNFHSILRVILFKGALGDGLLYLQFVPNWGTVS